MTALQIRREPPLILLVALLLILRFSCEIGSLCARLPMLAARWLVHVYCLAGMNGHDCPSTLVKS